MFFHSTTENLSAVLGLKLSRFFYYFKDIYSAAQKKCTRPCEIIKDNFTKNTDDKVCVIFSQLPQREIKACTFDHLDSARDLRYATGSVIDFHSNNPDYFFLIL